MTSPRSHIVDVTAPIELVPVLDVMSLKDLGEVPLRLDGYAHLVRLDRPSSVDSITRVVAATRPPGRAELSLDGGYAMLAGSEVLFTPQCCGDLGTLGDWEEAMRGSGEDWSELWIGHPCLAYRRDGDALLLQGYVEPGETATCPLPDEPIYRLEIEALAVAVFAARLLCLELAPRLEEALRNAGYARSSDLVARLLGLS